MPDIMLSTEAAGFAPLTTERLTLRPLRAEDAEVLHRLLNDWEVACTLAAVPYPYDRDRADAWIAYTHTALTDGTAYHLAITGREGTRETLVGGVGLRVDAPRRSARLGYWVGRRFWGHGVATEAAGRMARWALANLDLDTLEASAAIGNAASAAVLARIGFRDVGEGREYFEVHHAERPVRRYVATRDDLFGPPGTNTEVPTDAVAPDPSARPVLLVAACALIDADGRVLIARRPEGKSMAGLWEFPGGKLAPGETPEAALIRELREELGIETQTACLAPFAFASHAYERFHLMMPLYLCRRWSGTPRALEGQALAWVRPERLADYPMPPADRPLIPMLRDFL